MNRDAFDQLARSVRQAGKIRRGQIKAARVTKYRAADVRAIRLRLRKSQPDFALMIGVSVATLRNWEQGRRNPVGPAQALLKVASENPDVVAQALAAR